MSAWPPRLVAWRVRGEIVARRYSAWPLVVLALGCAVALALQSAEHGLRARIAEHRAALERHGAATTSSAAGASAQVTRPARAATPPAWDIASPAMRQAEDLKRLFALARDRGLQVAQADYTAATDGTPHVAGVQVQLPLAGTYPQVRRFAEDVLRAMPHASLDQIGLERDAVGETRVTARLRMTLWYRP